MDIPTQKPTLEFVFDTTREPASQSGDTQQRLRRALWVSVWVHGILGLGIAFFWPLPPPAFRPPQFQIILQEGTHKKPVETKAVLADPNSTTETPADDVLPEITPKPTAPTAQPRPFEASAKPLDLSLPPLETPSKTLPPNEHSAIFHPQLNARFHQAVARNRAQSGEAKPAQTYFNTFGEEIIEFNGKCAKIQRARDHHDLDTVALPTPCPGYKDEGTRMMERLNENLRKRYGSKLVN